jgi:hypothetical protein
MLQYLLLEREILFPGQEERDSIPFIVYTYTPTCVYNYAAYRSSPLVTNSGQQQQQQHCL